MKKPISLDLTRPGYPPKVVKSLLSGQIIKQCEDLRIPIPVELRKFCKDNAPEMGINWEIRVMKASPGMTIEQLKSWIDVMRPGECRSNMRAILSCKPQVKS